MSNATIPMSEKENLNSRQIESWHSAAPVWWVVLSRELADLWVGGKALYMIVAFSILLGIETFVLATNFELSLYTPQETVFEILKSVIQISLLIGLIIGADSISGERERATLEGLLLTPATRRQIIFGKFLGALSAWPVALVIAIPFMGLLSQATGVFGPAVLLGLLVGALLIPAFTAIGMMISIWCNSNKTSFFISLGIFLIVILMGQVIGTTKIGLWGQLLLAVNPLPAGFDFLSKLLVSNRTLAESWTALESPFIFAVVVIGLLFLFVGPQLRIEAGRMNKMKNFWSKVSRMLGMAIIAGLMLMPSTTSAMALPPAQSQGGDLQIAISLDSKTVKTGDSIDFDTVLTNVGTEKSPPVIAAMNIINLSKTGDVVDPEDWSPERTQYVESLGPNETTKLSWQVNAVLDGNFMVYIVAIPQPGGEGTSTQAVASRGLHLSVTKFTSLNPSGVLPFAVGVPIVVVLAILVLFRLRNRQVDAGEAA